MEDCDRVGRGVGTVGGGAVRREGYVILGFKAHIINELSSWWSVWLEVPCLVKLGMVAAFDQARVEIEVKDVLIGGGIAKEDSAKVVAVQLAATVTRAFNADSGPKQLSSS